jgi:hypothetical protein
MTWNTIETKNSRRIKGGANGQTDLEYRIRWDGTGIPDDIDIVAHVLDDVLPASFGVWPLKDWEIKPAGWKRWMIAASYGPRSNEQQAPADDSVSAFETGGGTQHVKISRATVQVRSVSGETAPNTYNQINVDAQQVGGTDIVIPVFTFEETKVFPFNSVNAAYKMNLFTATGRVNNATYKGFAAGEVLFMGASGRSRGTEEYSITGRFAASPNITGLSVGDITGINKNGWDFLWLMFEDNTSEGKLLKKPIHAFVERLYLPHNFGLLGL